MLLLSWMGFHAAFATETLDPVPLDGAAGTSTKGADRIELTSRDGRFELVPGLRAQYRYRLESVPTVENGRMASHAATLRRARVGFKGHAWGEHNTYKVELAFEGLNNASRTPLLTWQAAFTYIRDLNIRMGQFKVPFHREYLVSSRNLATIDRSIADSEFGFRRDIGLDLGSKDLGGLGWLRYNVGVYAARDGEDASSNLGVLTAARVEVLPFGTFDSYVPQDFERSSPRLAIGLGHAFVSEPQARRDIVAADVGDQTYAYHSATADLLFKAYGFSTLAAVFLRDGGESLGLAEVGTGFSVESTYMTPGVPVGLTGRYARTDPFKDSAMTGRNEVGGALSWHIVEASNALKLQAEFVRQWEERFEAGEDTATLQLQMAL